GVRVVDVWSGLGIFGAAYGRTVGGCSACSIARVSYALLQLRFRGGSVSCGDSCCAVPSAAAGRSLDFGAWCGDGLNVIDLRAHISKQRRLAEHVRVFRWVHLAVF